MIVLADKQDMKKPARTTRAGFLGFFNESGWSIGEAADRKDFIADIIESIQAADHDFAL